MILQVQVRVIHSNKSERSRDLNTGLFLILSNKHARFFIYIFLKKYNSTSKWTQVQVNINILRRKQ